VTPSRPSAAHGEPPRERYRPPEGDEPLDAVELALVHALVPVLVAEIREELLAEAAARAKQPPPDEEREP